MIKSILSNAARSTRYHSVAVTRYRAVYSSQFDCCTWYGSCGYRRCCRKPKPRWCCMQYIQCTCNRTVMTGKKLYIDKYIKNIW